MLKTMRKNVKALKPMLWIIIATFVVAIFAIWGGSGRLGEESRQSNTLVTIGKERVTSDVYYQTLRQRLEALKKEYSQLNRNLVQQLNIPQRILQQLVEQAQILQIARDMKLVATDKEISDRIHSYPVFQRDGRFIGYNDYRKILEWNKIPLNEFESGLRKEILMGKVAEILTAGTTVSEDEVWTEYRNQNETAKIEYLFAEKSKIEIADKPGAAAIQSHYEMNKSKYKVPEKRTADYVFFKTEEFKKDIKVVEADIESYYKENIAQFKDPEKIKVSRVYLPFTDKDKAQVLATAEDILRKAAGGWDFADLARKHSKDDKAALGGDWGTSAWQSLSAKESEEIRKLEAGKISGVVEIDGAAVLFKVTEKTAEITRPLAEVKTMIRSNLEERKARSLAEEKAVKLEKAARRQKSLDSAARKEGLTVKNTGLLKSGDPIDAVDPSGAIAQTLFTLKDRDISSPIYTYSGIALIQFRKTEPERPANLEEARADVEKDLLDTLKKTKVLAKINDVRASLKDKWEEAAQKNNFQYKVVDSFKRGQYLSLLGEDSKIDAEIFSLPISEPGRPIEVEDGYVMFRVLERKQVQKADFDKVHDTERANLLERQKSKFLQSYMVKQREENKLKVNYELYLKLTEDVLSRFAGD